MPKSSHLQRPRIRLTSIAALVLIASVGFVACGGSARTSSSTSMHATTRTLTAAQSGQLVRWFSRLRTCLAKDALAPGTLHVTPKQLSVSIAPGVAPNILAAESLSCTGTGVPPYDTSLHALRGRMVLNLPQQWLLDEKAAARAVKTVSSSP